MITMIQLTSCSFKKTANCIQRKQCETAARSHTISEWTRKKWNAFHSKRKWNELYYSNRKFLTTLMYLKNKKLISLGQDRNVRFLVLAVVWMERKAIERSWLKLLSGDDGGGVASKFHFRLSSWGGRIEWLCRMMDPFINILECMFFRLNHPSMKDGFYRYGIKGRWWSFLGGVFVIHIFS